MARLQKVFEKDTVVKADYETFEKEIRLQVADCDTEVVSLGNVLRKVRAGIEELKKNMEERMAKVEENSSSSMAALSVLSFKVNDKDNIIKDIEKRIAGLERTKEEKVKVAALKERFDVFSDVETITALRDTYMPRIAGFAELVDQLEASHEEMHDVIRGFDESMSTKANKSTVQESFTMLEEKYIVKKDLEAIDDRFTKVLKEIEATSEAQSSQFVLMRKEQLQEVQRVVEGAVVAKLDSYEKITKMFE